MSTSRATTGRKQAGRPGNRIRSWVLAWLLGISAVTPAAATSLDYTGQTPEGLVGNGRTVVRVQPERFQFHEGGDARGRLLLRLDGRELDLTAAGRRSARFFPGGVQYRLQVGDVRVEVLHGATEDAGYVMAVRVHAGHRRADVALDAQGTPALVMQPGRAQRRGSGAHEWLVRTTPPVATPQATTGASFDAWRERFEQPYRSGLLLRTPNARVDRAVPFNRFLLDLGFNGRLHVCELFRWRDVWSRDLGSGLAPGALLSGRFDAARRTVAYDLERHARADPRGLKVTEDPSQGGSAEGVAWLTQAVWRDYLMTGDRPFLQRAAATLRPWLQAWLDRDPDGRGLLVDDTEWMDHSRFFLFPDGARVLYSNALFTGLLGTFAAIERELGDAAAAQRLAGLRQRFVAGLDTLWNEAEGRYDNLSLWGLHDRRSSSDGNVLAVLAGAATAERVPRILQAVRRTNWRSAGSVTITPPMTHVDAGNDHNFKVWPWWNAVEAKARFLHGDVDGGVQLLEAFSRTLDDAAYPGLVEELVTPDGVSEGGHAFVTAAGAYQDAVVTGLLGVQVLQAGRVRMRVAPNVPRHWLDWSARVPLPGGWIDLVQRQRRLHVAVHDRAVQVVEVAAGTRLTGARRATLGSAPSPVEPVGAPASPAPMPPPPARRAALFTEPGIPVAALPGLPRRTVSADDLGRLHELRVQALVVAGNALPRATRSGTEVAPLLSRFLDQGGAIVFHGATQQHRQTMGEQAGVVDWYGWRPRIDYTPITGWRFRASPTEPQVKGADEHGLRQGWPAADLDDRDWQPFDAGRSWADHPPERWNGWQWARARFELPAQAAGRPVLLTLGWVNLRDTTFLNGQSVDGHEGRHVFRSLRLEPADPRYALLKFGGVNQLAVQVYYEGDGGGLSSHVPTVGIERTERAWVPLDGHSGEAREQPSRFGAQSWGPGPFFPSWEASRGAFGFRIDGRGVDFTGPLSGLPPLDGPTASAFTDFAVALPWRFEPLAFTRTQRALLVPEGGERYPAAARVRHQGSGGEFMLVGRALAESAAGPAILQRLGLRDE